MAIPQIRASEVIDIQNIHEYMQSVGKFDTSDFVNCKMPFDSMFLEYSLLASQVGMLAQNIEPQPVIEAIRNYDVCGLSGIVANWYPFMSISLDEAFNRTRSIIGLHIFSSSRGIPMFNGGVAHFFLDSENRFIGFFNDSLNQNFDTKVVLRIASVAMLAISFMNCKNVTRTDVTCSEGPSDKWLRRQKLPKLRYHVLNINPMKEVLRTEGGIEKNGPAKALHICRGHFATYTEDKPLFGRSVGTFWIPQHVRGKAENGMVIKDYKVNAPAGNTQ